MENFLLSEEKLENTKNQPKDLENDIDMFQNLQSDNEVINAYQLFWFETLHKLNLNLLIKCPIHYFWYFIIKF